MSHKTKLNYLVLFSYDPPVPNKFKIDSNIFRATICKQNGVPISVLFSKKEQSRYISDIYRLTSILTSSREPSKRVTRARTSFPLLTGVFFFEGDGELAGPFSTPSGSTAAGILVSSGIVAPYYLQEEIKNGPQTAQVTSQ
jgi:hypothetical protein